MRILITEKQFNRLILIETKQDIITDDKLEKAKKIVTKLNSRGFSVDESSAIVGNMWAESKLNSSAISPNGAIGLMQWLGDRKKALESYSLHKKTEWSEENTQIDFIKIELKDGYKLDNGKFIPNLPKKIESSNKYEIRQFNSAMGEDTIRKKASSFAKLVERCGDCDGTIDIRKESAKKIYDYVSGTYKPSSGEDKKVGSTVYPKETEGYVNVRQKPSVGSEILVKVSHPNKIGVISKISKDSSGYNWYLVSLTKKVNNSTTGWVRSDVVK